MANATATKPASEGQIRFVLSLFSEAEEAAKSGPEAAAFADEKLAPWADLLTAAVAQSKGVTVEKPLTGGYSGTASKLISFLKEIVPQIKRLAPVEGFRYVKPVWEGREQIFPIVGPEGHDGERVTVKSSKGERETIVSFWKQEGPNHLYTGLSPREMKALDASEKDAEQVRLVSRIADLFARFDVASLRVAWPTADNVEGDEHGRLAFWAITERAVIHVIGGNRREMAANATAHAILDRLESMTDAEVVDAARLFGQELGSCGRCGRSLTDDESRAVGIGPICRRKGF